MDRDPGSNFPQDFRLLEDRHIEAPPPKRERGAEPTDATTDDCDAERARHVPGPLRLAAGAEHPGSRKTKEPTRIVAADLRPVVVADLAMIEPT